MTEKFKGKIKVAGRAVEYWGSQSISSDSSAIFELIKNARDADATKVEIKFEKMEDSGGRITITDDGHGMTREKITNSWLVAGTNSKLIDTKSKKGRRMWGEMGIGRFSCERLAEKTAMTSLPYQKNEKIVMHFDWEKYKAPEITFENVEHDGYMDTKSNPEEHGLVLELKNLKSRWNNEKVRSLKRDLGSYILPREFKGPDDFEILITAEEFHIKNEPVESSIIRTAPLQMKSEYDGGEMTIKIRDATSKTKEWKERESVHNSEKSCGPFKFRLFFYPRDSGGKTRWTKYYHENFKSMEIGDFLHRHSGIYLYRDDAWMKPYGRTHDWLGLEGRRVQRRSKIGLTQVFGIVSISQDNNPGIRHTAHREVLQGTREFEDLKSLIMMVIKDFENYRQESYVETKPDGTKKPEVMAGNNLSQIIRACRSRESLTASETRHVLQYATSTQKHLEEYKKRQKENAADEEYVRSHELNVMSMGLTASYVSHELESALNGTMSAIADMGKTMNGTGSSEMLSDNPARQRLHSLETLEENSKKIAHFLSFIGELSSHVTVSGTESRRTDQFRLKDVWDMVAGGFRAASGMSEIETEYVEQQKDLEIRFDRIDLESILSNLMANSIEALRKEKPGQGMVRLEAVYAKDGLQMKFSDNGCGIKFDDREKIFEPFITTNNAVEESAYGHGLGLSIAREILQRHAGQISASSPGFFDTGATFAIRIPSEKVTRVM